MEPAACKICGAKHWLDQGHVIVVKKKKPKKKGGKRR